MLILAQNSPNALKLQFRVQIGMCQLTTNIRLSMTKLKVNWKLQKLKSMKFQNKWPTLRKLGMPLWLRQTDSSLNTKLKLLLRNCKPKTLVSVARTELRTKITVSLPQECSLPTKSKSRPPQLTLTGPHSRAQSKQPSMLLLQQSHKPRTL